MMHKEERRWTLDALRGVAAVLVALFHFGQSTGQVVPGGYLAVDLFFALSGFVIALSYGGRLANGLSARRFLVIRLIRLYPMYAAGLMIGAAVKGWGLVAGKQELSPAGFAEALALGAVMLPQVTGPGLLFPLNAPSWSLFDELLVNALFAGLLYRWRIWTLAAVGVGAGAILVAVIQAPNYFNTGFDWHNFADGWWRALFSFAVGMVLQRLLASRARRASWWALAPIVGAAVLLMASFNLEWRWTAELLIVLIGFPILLAGAIMLDVPTAIRRPCATLGDLSYPLYAIHFPLRGVAAKAAAAAHLPTAIAAMLYLCACFAVAALLARYLDAPLRRLARRRLRHEDIAPQPAS